MLLTLRRAPLGIVLIALLGTPGVLAGAPEPAAQEGQSFADLVAEVEALGTRLAVARAAAATLEPKAAAGAGATSPRQTPPSDVGSVQQGASEEPCCRPDVERLRAILERVQSDRAVMAQRAGTARNPKAAREVAGLEGLLATFNEALGQLERAPDAKRASQHFQTLSNVSKTLHASAKAILQNLRA